MVRVHRVEKVARSRSDELDERRYAQRPTDVMHVPDEHHDADDDEHERNDDGDAGTTPSSPLCTSRSASTECANVPTKIPIAS